MPTGVFDASLITQRARAKAESNSFINRIQNPTNPTTSYGPLTGIYDNSEVNRVTNGQMKYFQRNGACTVAYIGCPCIVTVNGQVANNVVIVAPGQVTGVQAQIGSIIVTWNEATGTGPLTYTITTTPPTTPVSVIGSTQYIYTNPTSIFTPGSPYTFQVRASYNDINGPISVPSDVLYAPYDVPGYDIDSTNADPNTIFININPTYSAFTPNQYILKMYVNNSVTPTILGPFSYSPSQIEVNSSIVPSISCLNVYSFQIQLIDGNNKTSFTSPSDNEPVFPNGPDITGVTNITSTTAKINYDNYYTETNGFDLTTGDAICNIYGPGTGYGYLTPLANTFITITGLIPFTTYTQNPSSGLRITFEKTINDFDIDSAQSTIPTFTTNGIAPFVTSSLAPTANNATIIFNPYASGTTGQFDFTGATFSISGVTIETITQPTEIYIGGLSPATQYTNVTMTLTGAGGAISDPSNLFTIVTRSFPVSDLAFSTSTPSTINLTFTKPSNLPGAVASASVYYDNGVSQFGSVNLISQTELQIFGLSESSTFNNVTVVLSDGTYLSGTPSNIVDSISTADPIPDAPQNVQPGTTSYITQEITFDPYSSPYNLTQAFISGDYGYDNLTQSGLTITGLLPGTYYSGLTFQVGTTGGLSNSANIPDFTTDSLPSPEQTGTSGSYDGFYTTISISYNTYPIPPTSGKLYTSNGTELGTDNNPSTTALTITDLPVGNYYANCYIVLFYNNSPSPNSNTFYVTTTPITDAIQNPSYGPNPITITFTVTGASNINGATLYVPAPYGNYAGSNVTSSSAEFSPSFIDQISDCYIILSDNSNPTLPSNTFTVDTRYPPPQNIGTTVQSDSVTVSFTYSAFTPNSGTLYTSNYGSFSGSINSGSGNYELIVSGLSPGTDYGESYIQVSDGVGATSTSSSTFQLTTNP